MREGSKKVPCWYERVHELVDPFIFEQKNGFKILCIGYQHYLWMMVQMLNFTKCISYFIKTSQKYRYQHIKTWKK